MDWLTQHWSEITVTAGVLGMLWRGLVLATRITVRLENHMAHTEQALDKILAALTILLDRSR